MRPSTYFRLAPYYFPQPGHACTALKFAITIVMGFFHCCCCPNRVIQESGVNSPVPVYVVGVFSGDQMIAEGTKQILICPVLTDNKEYNNSDI